MAVVVTMLLLVMVVLSSAGGAELGATYEREFTMPGVSPQQPEQYLCTVLALNSSVEEWVVKYDPMASANRAHHMLLYGCSDVPQYTGYWECDHHGVCTGGQIMYAWAKNAPALELPSDVGYRIGGSSSIQFLTLQVHYAVALPDVRDHSGLTLVLTTTRQKYKAGILLLADGNTVIPPNEPKVHADMVCRASDCNVLVDIFVFGYRVHTHALGVVVSGYRYNYKNGGFKQIAKGNPQWPQAFYPMDEIMKISPDDVITARCTFNSTGRNRYTYIGSTAKDEMCNLYLMYYTDREKGVESAFCGGVAFSKIRDNLPEGNDVALPPNLLLEEKARGENTNKQPEVTGEPAPEHKPITVVKKPHQYKKLPQPAEKFKLRPKPVPQGMGGERQGKQLPSGAVQPTTGHPGGNAEYKVAPHWSDKVGHLGQVTAVALDSSRNVVIFHRGGRVWDGSSFTQANRLVDTTSVIATPTLVHLDKDSGAVLGRWGKDFFFMPHGLTIDTEDQLWLTDVGMHQVFKFAPKFGDGKPLLTLGTRFEPGSDSSHFCKPTAVAVMKSGEFFVADGYCNGRVIKYTKEGKVITQFGKMAEPSFLPVFAQTPSPPGTFLVPHSLALAEDKGEVCVADRENGRVQCYDVSDDPHHTRQFKIPQWGNIVYAVAYSSIAGGRMYCVNGAQMYGGHKVQVFELDFASGDLLDTFSPNNQGLSQPHDITVSDDGAELYVAEIGPNKIWKFEAEELLSARPSTAGLKDADQSEQHFEQLLRAGAGAGLTKLGAGHGAGFGARRWTTTGVTAVVLALMLIPIVVLVLATLIIKAKRRGTPGKVQQKKHGRKGHANGSWRSQSNGLGAALLHKHKGFKPLATEDHPSSGDSDVEEYSQIISKA